MPRSCLPMYTSTIPEPHLHSDPVSIHGLFGTAFRLTLERARAAEWGELYPWLATAHDAGIVVSVCEAAVGRELPSYSERRLWRAALPCPFRTGILVFTDSARLSSVWSWTEAEDPGPVRYLEHRLPGRETTLERGLRSWPSRESRASPALGADRGPAVELLRALRRRCPRIPSEAVLTPSTFQAYVEECGDLDGVRAMWRAMRRIRALDLASDPSWLLAIGRSLEAIYLALIERMRVAIDERTGAPRHRPEYLRDFREVVDRAEGPRWDFDRRRYVRRIVAQQHLFAAVHPGAHHDRSRASLLGFAGVSDPSTALLACNTCDLQLLPPRSSRRRAENASGGGSGEGRRRWMVEVEILRRGWSAVRAAEVLGGGPHEEVVRAVKQIDARRRELLRRMQYGPKGDPAGEDGIWPLLFSGVASWKDFDLLRK